MRGPWRRFRWLTPGLYLTLLAAAPVGTSTSTATPDLSGSWTLNEEQSQVERPAQGTGGGRQGGWGGGGHRGGRRSGGGDQGGSGGEGQGGGRRGSGDQSQREGEEHRGAPDLGLPKELKIAASGPQLTLAATDGAEPRVLYTDGRKMSEDQPGVGTVKTQASWKDGALTVVTESPKGRKKTEIFEMTHDRKRLYVLVTLEGYGRMSGVTFKRVYDPATPSEAAPAQPTEQPPVAPGDDDDNDDYEIA